MIKNLVSFGCSWPHGVELIDPKVKEQGLDEGMNDPYRLSHSYPGIIAGHYGWNLVDHTYVNASLSQIASNYFDWVVTTPKKDIAESFVLVGLTHETAENGRTEDEAFEDAVAFFDSFAKKHNIQLLQFNVLARQHKLKYPTLIESSSALEMLVIRDKPRKDPLFAEYKHPNEKGHKIISEFLIDKINSVILNQ